MNQDARQVKGGDAAHVGVGRLVSLVLDLLHLLIAHLLAFRRKLTMGRSQGHSSPTADVGDVLFPFSLEEKFFQTS